MKLTSARRSSTFNKISQRRHRPDYALLIISSILLVFGLIVVYSISPGLSAQKNVSESYYVNKQIIAIILGVITFAITASMPTNLWRKLERPLLFLAALSAVVVRIFGENINGAYRWIQIGGLSFQVVELIKFALIIWLAGFLVDRAKNGELSDFRKTLRPLLIILLISGFVVAKLQSDLGSAAVLVAIMVAMAFIVGMPMKKIIMIGGIILIGGALLISTSSYRRDRFQTFLQPSRDCQNAGYQACQALIAVGSGGLTGLGLAHSVQAYGYLPEAANDSIFAIFAEKFGFLGVSTLLAFFIILFTRLKRIIDRAPDEYSRLITTGVLAWISTQMIINVGAMIGLLPLKGITLPFISYGGTSLLFITGALGIVFHISRYTSYGRNSNTNTNESSTNNNNLGRGRDRRSYFANPSRRG